MKNSLLGIFICFISIGLQAQLVSRYNINIEFFPENAQIRGYSVSNDAFMRGNSRIEFSEINAKEAVFYLHGELEIDSIISRNTLIKYTSKKVIYSSDYSRVAIETTISSSDLKLNEPLDIYYSGFMNPSRARSLSDYMHINKKTGVFLRSYGYSLWFPVFLEQRQESYMANFESITVNLPKKFTCIISGELMSETIDGDRYIAVWKPGMVDVFSIQCTAREYKLSKKDNLFIYYVGNQNNANKILNFTQKLKKIYAEKLRSINDTSSLRIIEMPKYGNLSSQNSIGISTDVYNDFDNSLFSKLTIAHELVHPFVKIPVSKDNSFSALVVEGFPSFFHLYGLKKTLGPKAFDLENYMKQIEKGYLKKKLTGKDRRGNKLPLEKPILEISSDDIGTYKDRFILSDRVSLFLYHIWTKMGDNNFDRFLKELFQFSSIDYTLFEGLLLKYIPTYKNNLNSWLNTNDYPESLHISSKIFNRKAK